MHKSKISFRQYNQLGNYIMGLDQYAYAVSSTGERSQLQEWRKHPNLQGFMEQKWEDKGRLCFKYKDGEPKEVAFNPDVQGGSLGDFNCVPILLYPEDIDDLEEVVNNDKLPDTAGFFFGQSRADD